MMFHAVADNYRELGELRVPGRNLSLAEQENRMAQNLRETVQILQHQGSSLDRKFRQVYPVCLADEMELLNFAFPLTGPEATAPIPWPMKWERGLQVSGTLAQPQRRVFLGEAKLPATMTMGKEPKAHLDSPSPDSESNFAMAFALL